MTITIVYHTLYLALAFTILPFILAHPLSDQTALTPSILPGLSINKNVIVQLFQWNWNSVAQECTTFLGPAGYGYVQVSPPSEHISGHQWWTDYQPISYNLDSKHGSREEFASMVAACRAAGVKVMPDTVLNHMSSQAEGTGVGKSSFKKYNYPGHYTEEDFHSCRVNITDYSNRDEVQNCEYFYLADLATEKPNVQAQMAAYMNDLYSLGVEGYRLDAAKYIPASHIAAVLSGVPGEYLITQEVTTGPNEAVKPEEYAGNGCVLVFDYMHAVKAAFTSGNIASLQLLDDRGWVPSDKANTLVTDSDSERRGWNTSSTSHTYVLSMIFSLAHPYGQHPMILSSFRFSDIAEGAPVNGGSCHGDGLEEGDNGGWRCQHRWQPVVGMVGFRNMVGASDMRDFVAPEPHRIAFGRGSFGFVAINNGDEPWLTTFTTSMADGEYSDVISKDAKKVQVTGGKLAATVPPRGALAIHIGSRQGLISGPLY